MVPDLTALADALVLRAREQTVGSRPTQRELADVLAAVLRAVAAEHPTMQPNGGILRCDGHGYAWPDYPCPEVRAVLAAVEPLLPLLGVESVATEKEEDHG